MAGKRILLVEGNDDEHVIKHICDLIRCHVRMTWVDAVALNICLRCFQSGLNRVKMAT